jgi:hypothetical protein
VRLSADRLAALLHAAPRDPHRPERALVEKANFLYATFDGDVDFEGTTFGGHASFESASFTWDAAFREVTFNGPAGFAGTTFGGSARFDAATFNDRAYFERASFEGDAGFEAASFGAEALFGGATFNGHAHFRGVRLGSHAVFSEATFSRGGEFSDSVFAEAAWFGRTTFRGLARFLKATFRGEATFGEVAFDGEAHFDGATFGEEVGFSEASFGGAAHFTGASFGGPASFSAASFSGDAKFEATTAHGYAQFDNVTFSGDAEFGDAAFKQVASFESAIFRRSAHFRTATFDGPALFGRARFRSFAGFDDASFGRDARFDETSFGGWEAGFDGVTFNGAADFEGAVFLGEAKFGAASFGGDARFREALFADDARFEKATFDRARELGPIHVFQRLWLDGAVFVQHVVVEASSRRASFARTAFRGGATLRLRWAEVWLEDTDFAEPSVVAELEARLTPEGERTLLGWEAPRADGSWETAVNTPEGFAPRVLSLRGARVSELALSGVTLTTCRFAGAHGLDDLGYEHAAFAEPPRGWRWVRLRPLRWTYRRTIAEEHHWRAAHSDRYGRGWELPEAGRGFAAEAEAAPWPPEAPRPLEGEQVAGLYRELRKGREDKKDEPGAADFYYGEMELRRHSARWTERSILWLYWIASGYGLRASRALLALAVTIALGALLLAMSGFEAGEHAEDGTLLFSLESSISLFRAPEGKLTPGGHVIQIVLRLAGPLLFGLALLALRGRVKR